MSRSAVSAADWRRCPYWLLKILQATRSLCRSFGYQTCQRSIAGAFRHDSGAWWAGDCRLRSGASPHAGLASPAGSHPGQPSFPTTTRRREQSASIHPTACSPSSWAVRSIVQLQHRHLRMERPESPTASYAFNTATGKGKTISYSYTLLDNTLSAPKHEFRRCGD